MLGFATEAEAEAWIEQDKRLSNGTASYEPRATALG
jgi:hypothetical protein